LDKTGTVTQGKMRLVEVLVPRIDGRAAARPVALAVAGAVEEPSEHPIAVAIAAAAEAAGKLPALVGFQSAPGGGAAGTLQPGDLAPAKAGQDDNAPAPTAAATAAAAAKAASAAAATAVAVRTRSDADSPANEQAGAPNSSEPMGLAAVGKASYLRGLGFTVPSAVEEAYQAAAESGGTAVLVGWNGQAQAVLVLRDEPKTDSASAIKQLKALGVRPLLVTGDSKGAALVAAKEVGIAATDVRAQVPPEGKVKVIQHLQAEGRVVAMVGDGVNDAAAIAAADLGMAMGSGTDVANHAADITLMRNTLTSVPQAIRLSRATLRVIKQNLFWAFAYNVAMLPLAVAGWASPMLAGAAMAFSSLIVVSNSLRLARFSHS
jgi:Cu+-exporting ATPase